MNMEDEEFSPFGGYGSGCDIHGEDFLRECTMCGIEFCSACFPNSALCSDCAAQAEFDDDEDRADRRGKGTPPARRVQRRRAPARRPGQAPDQGQARPKRTGPRPRPRARPKGQGETQGQAAPKAKAKAADKNQAPKAKPQSPRPRNPAEKPPPRRSARADPWLRPRRRSLDLPPTTSGPSGAR
jgi:hypothetical protein